MGPAGKPYVIRGPRGSGAIELNGRWPTSEKPGTASPSCPSPAEASIAPDRQPRVIVLGDGNHIETTVVIEVRVRRPAFRLNPPHVIHSEAGSAPQVRLKPALQTPVRSSAFRLPPPHSQEVATLPCDTAEPPEGATNARW